MSTISLIGLCLMILSGIIILVRFVDKKYLKTKIFFSFLLIAVGIFAFIFTVKTMNEKQHNEFLKDKIIIAK